VVQHVKNAYQSEHAKANPNANIVRSEVDRIMRTIPTHITQQTHFEVKAQALRDAIEIAELFLNDGDHSLISREVRKTLPQMPVSSIISHILDTLLPEELAALQADGEISGNMHKLRSHAKKYDLDLRIDDLIDRLWLEESDQDEDDPMAL